MGAAIRSILLDWACGYFVLIALYALVLPSLLNVFLQTQQRAGIVALLAAGIADLLALGSLDRLPRALLRFRVLARSSNCRGKAVVSS